MTTHCFIPVLGKRLRVTELDVCGVPIPTTGMYIATDGFITVTLSSEVEDGTEIIVKKASGALCVNERLASSFKRFNVEIEFCGVNPSLLAMVANATPYEDYASDIAGFTVGEGEITGGFALELWTGLSGQACLAGQTGEASGYLLLPFVQKGVLGDITIDGENAVTFSLSESETRGGNQWGVGPYNVLVDNSAGPDGVLSPLPTALDPYDHLLLIDTAVAPPPVACEPVTIPSGIVATGATAGSPGVYTPAGADTPANHAGLAAVVASPTTAWTAGQYVNVGDGTTAHWDGTAGTTGPAAAVAGDAPATGGRVARKSEPVPA